MIRSNRRMLLKGGVALAALGAMPSALRAQGFKPAVFIHDARFAASRELADGWRDRGVEILDPRKDDLGIAWREHIPELLKRGGGIAGATLWSDRFICETFARQYGLSSIGDGQLLPGAAGGALRHWSIT